MQGLWMLVVSLAIMGRISVLAGVLLATVTQAMSEPYVLICKVQRLQNMPHCELIDRIFVDEPTQRIDFVASTTIGADKEVFVSFGNRPGYVAFGGNNTVTFYRFGNSLRISAMRFGFPVRGRDGRCRPPPAQIRAGPIRALGSYLGCLTAKRTLGHG